MADKHPIRTPVISGLILAAALSFVTFILPGGWGSVFHRIYQVSHWFWLWITSAVTISVWLLCILIILSTGFILTLLILMPAGLSKPNPKYTEDMFFGIRWRWYYGRSGIRNLASFCPTCDLQVYPRATMLGIYPENSPVIYCCDDCQRDLYESHLPHRQVEDLVTRKIQKHIRDHERKPNLT